jgi:hypothetical protein
MKSLILLFALISAFLAGCITESLSEDLFYYARDITPHGKPMPPISEWLFDHFGRWHNGGLMTLFIIPWALLVLYQVLPSAAPEDRHLRFFSAVLCFAFVEASLFLFLIFAALLPIVPHYITSWNDVVPLTAYTPQFILTVLAIAIVAAPLRRVVRLKRG